MCAYVNIYLYYYIVTILAFIAFTFYSLLRVDA